MSKKAKETKMQDTDNKDIKIEERKDGRFLVSRHRGE